MVESCREGLWEELKGILTSVCVCVCVCVKLST